MRAVSGIAKRCCHEFARAAGRGRPSRLDRPAARAHARGRRRRARRGGAAPRPRRPLRRRAARAPQVCSDSSRPEWHRRLVRQPRRRRGRVCARARSPRARRARGGDRLRPLPPARLRLPRPRGRRRPGRRCRARPRLCVVQRPTHSCRAHSPRRRDEIASTEGGERSRRLDTDALFELAHRSGRRRLSPVEGTNVHTPSRMALLLAETVRGTVASLTLRVSRRRATPGRIGERVRAMKTPLLGSLAVIGALFVAAAPASAAVVINEVESDDAVVADFVEVMNTGAAPVDLGGYVIKDSDNGHAFTIPSADDGRRPAATTRSTRPVRAGQGRQRAAVRAGRPGQPDRQLLVDVARGRDLRALPERHRARSARPASSTRGAANDCPLPAVAVAGEQRDRGRRRPTTSART